MSLLKNKQRIEAQYKPSEKFQWFPLKYHYEPLDFSSRTITKFSFVVSFGHFSNMI